MDEYIACARHVSTVSFLPFNLCQLCHLMVLLTQVNNINASTVTASAISLRRVKCIVFIVIL